MNNAYSPLVVFVYNRPGHTRDTLRALNDCDAASETDLFVFCDNYKKEKDKENVEAVRSVVDDFSADNHFKSVTVKKAETNLGLAASIITNVSEIIKQYNTAIVVEDDLIVSKYFLRYMNDALRFYEDDMNIWAISGYSFPMKALDAYPHDVFLSGRGCSWGWATWYNRWKTVDWSVNEYSSFKHNWIQRLRFSQWGADLPPMLDYQMYMDIDSWAIRWCFAAFLQGKMTVYPKRSYLMNRGIDGSGVHSKNTYTDKYDTSIDDTREYKCLFETVSVNEQIRKEFARKYSNGLRANSRDQLKTFLIRIRLWPIINRYFRKHKT